MIHRVSAVTLSALNKPLKWDKTGHKIIIWPAFVPVNSLNGGRKNNQIRSYERLVSFERQIPLDKEAEFVKRIYLYIEIVSGVSE